MSSTCFNPECDAEPIGSGVCLSCANSNYNPEKHGIDLGDGVVVEGGQYVR